MRESDAWAAWSRRAYPEYWRAVDLALHAAIARIRAGRQRLTLGRVRKKCLVLTRDINVVEYREVGNGPLSKQRKKAVR